MCCECHRIETRPRVSLAHTARMYICTLWRRAGPDCTCACFFRRSQRNVTGKNHNSAHRAAADLIRFSMQTQYGCVGTVSVYSYCAYCTNSVGENTHTTVVIVFFAAYFEICMPGLHNGILHICGDGHFLVMERPRRFWRRLFNNCSCNWSTCFCSAPPLCAC
jgi:hypothetical protein